MKMQIEMSKVYGMYLDEDTSWWRTSWWRWKKRVKKTGLKLNIQKTKLMASSQIDGEMMETGTDFILGGSKITANGDCSHEIKRHLLPGWKAMTNLEGILKSRHYLANKDLYSQSYGFSSCHVWMWELDHKESWALKNGCFWAVVLKTLESPWDPTSQSKGDQSRIFTGRTDAETEAPIRW